MGKTLLHDAVFVPPGYTSLLYAHGNEDNNCPHNTALFKVSQLHLVAYVVVKDVISALVTKLQSAYLGRQPPSVMPSGLITRLQDVQSVTA